MVANVTSHRQSVIACFLFVDYIYKTVSYHHPPQQVLFEPESDQASRFSYQIVKLWNIYREQISMLNDSLGWTWQNLDNKKAIGRQLRFFINCKLKKKKIGRNFRKDLKDISVILNIRSLFAFRFF